MKNILKAIASIMIILFVLILTACSSNSESEEAKMSQANDARMDSGQVATHEKAELSADNSTEQEQAATTNLSVPNKMVIYHADLELRVKKFEQTLQSLEDKVMKYGGYITESNVTNAGEEELTGRIVLRVPQDNFQAFLRDAEGQAVEILHRNVIGTDVTEEYVDLESRLKSKRVVEERLISFMNSAAKTEDLLKISADLAAVQEEIEVIQGRMKYLENQTAFSTVTITLFENKVIVPQLEDDDLNTWEKTKKQFMNSTNILLAVLSGFVVFLLGNLPIIGLFAFMAVIIFLYLKKIKRRKDNS